MNNDNPLMPDLSNHLIVPDLEQKTKGQMSLFDLGYNPDILDCLSSLSNDEVFTSPKLANQMLDLLPDEIWQDKTATFLDPVCKSGVFLREIVKRLDKGLTNQIPDKQTRINHILKNQVFGSTATYVGSFDRYLHKNSFAGERNYFANFKIFLAPNSTMTKIIMPMIKSG